LNELELRPPYASERTDEDIAARAVEIREVSIGLSLDRYTRKKFKVQGVPKGWIRGKELLDGNFKKTAAATGFGSGN